jgi:hypothetical protein
LFNKYRTNATAAQTTMHAPPVPNKLNTARQFLLPDATPVRTQDYQRRGDEQAAGMATHER